MKSKTLLSDRYNKEFLTDHLIPAEQWQPFPPASDRSDWNKLLSHSINQRRFKHLLEKAEMLDDDTWPALPATLYMDFTRTGNRTGYQKPYCQRRNNISILVLTECMEYKGRFLDQIANGIWSITEEATWCLPAHAARLDDDVLPRQDQESVDLYATNTAILLAETYYLLKDELMALSPALCDRIQRQIITRVIEPVETRDDINWLTARNNWGPWCASNVLGAGMYLIEEPDRLIRLTLKLMKTIDHFINHYGQDGGCDEGPLYWGVGPGNLLMFLELLHSRTNGAVDIYNEPIVKNMGRFIVNTHLHKQWFVNFADAQAKMSPRRPVVYRYGERVNDEDMKNLATLASRNWQAQNDVVSLFARHFLRDMIRELFWIPPDTKVMNPVKPTSMWLPDLQVLVARESEISGRGLILAAKGGNNDENHNHNDVGQFIIFLNGQPGIIDIGVETYCRQTFSSGRYDIWCIRASAHNVPVVNSVEQTDGEERCAENVHFQREGATQQLSMDIEAAYLEDAGLASLRREFVFKGDKPAQITIRDSFLFNTESRRISVSMYSPLNIEQQKQGCITINCVPHRLRLRYNPDLMNASIEEVHLDDNTLRNTWGNMLNRITFTCQLRERSGTYMFSFSEETH